MKYHSLVFKHSFDWFYHLRVTSYLVLDIPLFHILSRLSGTMQRRTKSHIICSECRFVYVGNQVSWYLCYFPIRVCTRTPKSSNQSTVKLIQWFGWLFFELEYKQIVLESFITVWSGLCPNIKNICLIVG